MYIIKWIYIRFGDVVDEVMDCFQMTYPDSSFDVVIDKSTLDTFLCSEELFERIVDYFGCVGRVLKKDGYFMIISINPPEAVVSEILLRIIRRLKLYLH